MQKEKIKAVVIEALDECLASEAFKVAIGPIVFDAVGQYLHSYELDLEKHHKDGTVERVKEKGDILAFIAKWISQSEAALRGVQSDACQARNRATETRDMVAAAMSIAAATGRPVRFPEEKEKRVIETIKELEA